MDSAIDLDLANQFEIVQWLFPDLCKLIIFCLKSMQSTFVFIIIMLLISE